MKVRELLPTIYRKDFLHISVWAWVTAMRHQGLTVDASVRAYQKYFGLEEDDAGMDSLKRLYYRACNNVDAVFADLQENQIAELRGYDNNELKQHACLLKEIIHLNSELSKCFGARIEEMENKLDILLPDIS